MKNKNLLIVSLLVAIIVLGGYIIYIKTKPKNLIVNNIITTTINTTKLALCSNQYYDTEYNKDGKITIKNFGASERIECSPEELESLPPSGGNRCSNIRFDIKYILDLTCLQSLNYPGSNVTTYLNDPDISLLAGFKNLEYFFSYYNSCKNLYKTLSNLKKLKSIDTDCSLENTDVLLNWPNLEFLHASLQEDNVQEINFNDIPSSIRELSFTELSYGDKSNYKITNIDQIANLVNLEKFAWWYPCHNSGNDSSSCEASENIKSLILQVVKLAPSIKVINEVNVDRNNFQWESFIKQVGRSS